jgi:hypothetical protein
MRRPGANGSNDTATVVKRAIREQLGRLVDQVSKPGAARKPYTALITSNEVEENGTLAFWRTHQTWNFASSVVSYDAQRADFVPSTRAYDDATWKVGKASPLAAGVLTSYAYLMRFQTNRSRANRFRIAFAQEHFSPPAGEIKEPGCSSDPNELDLTKRCTCQYCHKTLEPLAVSWGAFAENGSADLSDTKQYPIVDKDCKTAPGNRTPACARLYVTDKDQPGLGKLKALQFSDDHKDYAATYAKGPVVAAQALVASGAFARATVRGLYAYLVKRDPNDAPEVEKSLIDAFTASKYDFPALVRMIVKLPEYRRPA